MFLTFGGKPRFSRCFLSITFPARSIQCSAAECVQPSPSIFFLILFRFLLFSLLLPSSGCGFAEKQKKKTRPDRTRLSGRGVAGFSFCVPFWRACLSLSLSFPFPPQQQPAAISSNCKPKSEIPLVFLFLLDHLLLLARSSFSFPSPSLLPILPLSLPPSLVLLFGHQKALGTAYPSQVVAARFPFFPLSSSSRVKAPFIFLFFLLLLRRFFPHPHFLFPEFSLACPLLMPLGVLRSERQT